MDSAREISTGNIISGVDLRLLDPNEVDKDDYECWGCEVPVNPVSYRPENKKCPHFKLFEGTCHRVGCVQEEEELNNGKYRRRHPVPDDLPRPYVSRLVLNRKKKTGKTVIIENTPTDIHDVTTSGTGNCSRRSRHHFTAGTIRPFAKHFMQRVSERHLPIRIFSSEGETFDSVFAELPNEVDVLLPKEHIYFGQLYFSARTIESDKYVEIKLARGNWENNKLVEAYTVRIDTTEWSERAKNAVVREINETREEYREAYLNHNTSEQAWLFFIGEQDLQQPTLIHVRLHQFVCCFLGTYQRSRQYRRSWQPLMTRGNSLSLANQPLSRTP